MTIETDIQRAQKAKGRRPSRKSVVTRQKILDAAAAEFARNGYAATRLGDIADAVQMHLSGFYYYFDTKEALADQILLMVPGQTIEVVRESLSKLSPDAGHRERLGTAIQAHLQVILKNDNYVRAGLKIAQEAPAEIREHALDFTRQGSDIFRVLMEAARRDGAIRDDIDLTMARMILYGAINWSIEWFRPGRLTSRQFADELIKVIFDGIAPDRLD